MEQSLTLDKIKEAYPEEVIDTHSNLGQDTVSIAKADLTEVAEYIKNTLGFNVLIDLTAVDNWKKKPRYEVVYHLLSMDTKQRLRMKVPVEAPNPTIPTLTGLWKAANWYEREVYDMFGIHFEGHPDLRRILMYPEFEGHPLRKDYPITKRQPLIGPKD